MPTLKETQVQKLRTKKLYKIFNKEENHQGFQYKDGLNVDILEFKPRGTCEPGGLYFTTAENILNFLDYGIYIREVTIPEGEIVYRDPQGNKYKCHSLILGKRKKLWTKPIIKKLLKEGADIHVIDDFPLCYAAEYGHLEIVKFLVENGADVRIDSDSPLCYAARYGHTKIVEYFNNWIEEHG